MRNTIFAGLALAALAAVPAAASPAPLLPPEAPPLAPEASASPAVLLSSNAAALAGLAAQGGRVQVWLDGSRDLYSPGERIRARVRSDRDGYLAVFHIDTNGDVDIIYPYNESDDGWIEGGRTVSLGSRGGYDYVRSRGGYGMGYIMAVTLDEPLELWRVHDLYGVRTAGWDGNRSVFGDPFYAMDELVRAIVPEPSVGYEAVDYATYHVGQRRYRYPRYACYDGYGPWYTYRGVYWDDCDRVRILLVSYPWYYDTHRWRGSRRPYYERYYYQTARSRPLHGYKERTDGHAPPARNASSARRPQPSGRSSGGGSSHDRPEGSGRRPLPSGRGGSSGGFQRPDGAADVNGGVGRRPDRGGAGDSRAGAAQRPPRGTTRPVQDDAEPRQQDRPVQPSRERPTFQRRPQSEGGSRSAEPRREPQRSEEPRRESPPQRSAEPRRESPPARSAEPRREARPSSSSSSRSSGGSRSSSGGSSRSGGGSRSSAPPSRSPQ